MINRLFRKQILAEAEKLRPQIRAEEKEKLESCKVDAWKENCEFLFEYEGHTYHKYKDNKVIPLARLKMIHATEILLDSRLNNDELTHLIDIAEHGLENAFNTVKQSNRIEGVGTAVWAIGEMRKRKDRLMFHPTLLIELAAWTIIRDDEEPGKINMAIHQQKIDLFKNKGGDIPFLLQGNIGSALIKPEQYLKNIIALWDITKSELQYEGEAYEKILTELKSKRT